MDRSSISRKGFFKLVGGALGLSALSYWIGLRDHPQAAPREGAPDYIDDGSDFPVFRGPYLQKDAQLAALLFPAELAALTALCDRTLNRVPNSPFKYVPLMANLLVVYADMLVSSTDERAARIGSIPETEVGFWLLTAAMQKTAAGTVAHHLAWFIPYLFVNESNAMTTGREVYGFNKQAATFDKASDVQSPRFRADVLGFQRFTPDAVARKERLLEVSAPTVDAPQNQWSDWETARSGLVNLLLPRVRKDLGEEFPAWFVQAVLQNTRLVFLKQFRHSAEPQKACYQSLTETSLQLKTFRAGGLFSQPHALNLLPLESHPLAQKLGMKELQTSEMGVWLKVDFTLELGTEY